MPFDPNKPIRVIATPKRAHGRSRQGRDPICKESEALYALTHADYSPEVITIEREIEAAQKQVEDGTPEWHAFIERYGLHRADSKLALDEVGQWKLARLSAAHRLAETQGLPIWSARELKLQERLQREEMGKFYFHEYRARS